ncbi:MAG: ABC transporter substrate-binding protein [Desulfuromonadaceae bacterium]|nr:ABC transporter substrate-binding protein [Desulfuromonadaceae bacterium]
MKLPNSSMTIQQIVQEWPETEAVFVANDLKELIDPDYLQKVGRFMKLETALKRKGFAVETFEKLLHEKIRTQTQRVDITAPAENHAGDADIDVAGLLPCPVRVPLLEAVDRFVTDYTASSGLKISTRFRAASGGAEWIEEEIHAAKVEADLPDLFLSAGFDTFFDPAGIGQYSAAGAFQAIDYPAINPDFKGLDMVDPRGHYSIIAVVPAVFMVDLRELDTKVPRTWEALLQPEFERKVALPTADFDLFNAMLLTLHKEFGTVGIERLGRSMLESMHPAQMGQGESKRKPAVTIMPYFFTRMARNIPDVEIVWPEDGAIISPIFMLARAAQRNVTAPLAEFLAGDEVGTILATQGLFPSLNPQVENILPANAKWKWLGWDYIYSGDVAARIKQLDEVFQSAFSAED